MKNNLFQKEINLLDKQIQSYIEEKNNYITKKQFSINELLKTIDKNNSQISILKKKLDSDKKSLKSINETRENKLKNLLQQIEILQNKMNSLENQNSSAYDKDFALLNKEIENLKKQKKDLEKKIKNDQKRVFILEKKQNQENERNNMLKEEYFSCKKLLIMLTSKIESHSEFIKTLCKSRNALTSSLEKLNEIDPDNSEFSNNVIEMNKLAEMIYSYCNEYLEFNANYEEFIEKIKNQDDIDKVIDYLQEISKYKIPKNLCEYVLIALCRIMTYEKILDLRMKFINSIDINDQKNKNKISHIKINDNKENGIINENKENENKENINNDKEKLNMSSNSNKNDDKIKEEEIKDNEINKLLLHKKEYELKKLKIDEYNRILICKEKAFNKIKNDRQENINNIKNIKNDLLLMVKYKNKLTEKINKNEKEIMKRQKDYLQSMDNLNEEIALCKEKIVKKNLKLNENSKKYEDKIKELINIRNSIITSNKEYKTNEIRDSMIQMNLSPINKTNQPKNIFNLNNNKINSSNNVNNDNINNDNDYNNNDERNSLISITELIQSNNSAKNDNNKNGNNENTNDIFLNIKQNLSEKEYILLQSIKPLMKGVTILKRQIIHIKQKIYENYIPVINNKSTMPKDYYFKKYFLYLDKNFDKLHFQKLSTSDRSISVSPTSILRLEIPLFTKNLIFLQKIYSNLNKKLNLDSTKKINEYFIKEKNTIIQLYLENFGKVKDTNNNNNDINIDDMKEPIDEKIFDEKYREALLLNKQYMINIYLKPNEDTKIEILFQTRNDFKNWINGLDELISNYPKIKDIIKKNNNNILTDCLNVKKE